MLHLYEAERGCLQITSDSKLIIHVEHLASLGSAIDDRDIPHFT